MIKEAVFVIGEVCSGKTTFIDNELIEGGRVVELGQLVRDRYKTEERVYDNSLDEYLAEKVKEIRDKFDDDYLIIVGCRQVSLLEMLSELFEKNEYYYLRVPRQILKERFERRKAEKDLKLSFEEVIEGDEGLGINDLKLHLLHKVECEFIKNY